VDAPRAQPVPDAEGHVVLPADVQDVIPVLIAVTVKKWRERQGERKVKIGKMGGRESAQARRSQLWRRMKESRCEKQAR
jgi:hypothetical protein